MANEVNKNELEVGINARGEVVVNHGDLEPDENGCGHLVLSPAQARNLAFILLRKANEAEAELAHLFYDMREEIT